MKKILILTVLTVCMNIFAGWTFSLPILFKDIDDKSEIQKLNLFWVGSVYEVNQLTVGINNKDQINFLYYYVLLQ